MTEILFEKVCKEILREKDIEKKWKMYKALDELYTEKKWKRDLKRNGTYFYHIDDLSLAIAFDMLVPGSFVFGESIARYASWIKSPPPNCSRIFIVAKDIEEYNQIFKKIIKNLSDRKKYPYKIEETETEVILSGIKSQFKIKISRSIYSSEVDVLYSSDVYLSQILVRSDGDIYTTFGYFLSAETKKIPIFQSKPSSTIKRYQKMFDMDFIILEGEKFDIESFIKEKFPN